MTDAGATEADVVVMGTGAAALAAALSAHDAGASVAVIERSDTVGGTTAVSGGGVWMPCNHVSGADDSRDEALVYMRSLSRGRTSDDLLVRFAADGPGIVAGLEQRTRLRFGSVSWPDYHPEMEGARTCGRMIEPALFDAGALGEWAKKLRRAPVLGLPLTLQESTVEWTPSYTPERYDGAEIKRRVAANEVALRTGADRRALGRVSHPRDRTDARYPWHRTHLERRHHRGPRRRARRQTPRRGSRAVVLASGGYEWNAELCSRYLPGPLTHPTSPPVTEGDGLLMAMEVGADLMNMNEAWWYPAGAVPGEEYEGRQLAKFIAVERTAPHSIIVDRFGLRFVNEAANYNDMQKAFFGLDANQALPRHLPCWVVFDQQYRDRYPVINARPGSPDPDWLHRAPTLEDLAALVGIDPVGLTDTVGRWNGFVAEGRDRDFSRGDSFYDRFHGDPTAAHPTLGTVERAPFYALPGPSRCGRDERGSAHRRPGSNPTRPGPGNPRALRRGNVIASPSGPAYFGGGTTIGMGLVFGHIAGTDAAAFAHA